MVSRYGVKIRKTEGKIRTGQKMAHACPKCGKKKVFRSSTAIWKCASCRAVFAGGAYVPQTGTGFSQSKSVSKPEEKAGKY